MKRAVLLAGLVMLGWQAMAEVKRELFTVTAYCACGKCCGKWAKHKRTASGAVPVQGITVAGPRRLPFGTRVVIPGLGERVIQDRLARKYDNRIDVYFDSHKDALKWGIKKLEVTIK